MGSTLTTRMSGNGDDFQVSECRAGIILFFSQAENCVAGQSSRTTPGPGGRAHCDRFRPPMAVLAKRYDYGSVWKEIAGIHSENTKFGVCHRYVWRSLLSFP